MVREIVPSEVLQEVGLTEALQHLAQTKEELSQRELELATLQAEIATFNAHYLRVLGSRFAELDTIEAEIAEVLARSRPQDAAAQVTADRAREQATTSRHEAESVAQTPDRAKFAPSQELKELYRGIARRAHPDYATDEESRNRRTRFMAEVNAAYADCDLVRLRALLSQWETSPDALREGDSASRLARTQRAIKQIGERVLSILLQTERLRQTEIYRLMLRFDEAERSGRDLLVEMGLDLDQKITMSRARREALLREVQSA